MAKKSKAVEEVEDDDEVELEELDAEPDEDEDEAPKSKKKAKTKAPRDDEPQFGIQWLIKVIKKKTDKDYNPREVRTLLRKMAREDKPRVVREIIAGNRSRYSWTGVDDPEVKAILKAVGGGEIEKGKKEALDKLKQNKAAKDAKEAPAKGKKTKTKKASLPAPDEDDEDEDEDDE